MKKRPYYSHDVDARNDERIVRARIKHGAAGYSVYFMILEIMRNHPEYICETDYEVIAFDVREPVEVVKSVVEDFGLFLFSDDRSYFYSESFQNRMRRMKKRKYDISVQEWRKIARYIFSRDDYICQYCGSVGGILEVDHIIPFSKGGSDDIDNLTTSCRRCNRQKKDKPVEEFLKWRKERGQAVKTSD